MTSAATCQEIALTDDAASAAPGTSWDVCVHGLGYVGLPTAAVLATRGYRVIGVDLSPKVVDTVNAGQTHIVEPELDALVRAAVTAGNLRARSWATVAQTHLVCVPTPLDRAKKPDLGHVEAAARALVDVVRPGNLVVLESTVPPGTTRNLVSDILRQAGFEIGRDVFVAHAPERVLPGSVIREVVDNARLVGGVTDACTAAAAAFYEEFVRGDVYRTSSDNAELAKLVENSFRDVNIAFANELANVCDHLGLDVWEIRRLANAHPRVNVLHPGPGVGGHCVAVDPWFVVDTAPAHTQLIATARAINDARPEYIVEKVRGLAQRFRDPKIGCLGLAYKPDIDDLRESPALAIVRSLIEQDVGTVRVAEPMLRESPLEGIELADGTDVVRWADIVVVLVAHRAFRRIRKDLFTRPSVVDAAGLLATPDTRCPR